MQSTLHAKIIPGLLSISSNRRFLKGFPICEDLSVAECSEEEFKNSPMRVTFRVNPALRISNRAEGKAFKAVDHETVGMEVPLGRLVSVSCAVSFASDNPTLQVNGTLHRFGKITIGNVHSVGWLLRDLCNVHLLNNGYSLLHGAALRTGSACVLLIGLSNTGKTTTVKRMVSELDAQTFGDDLFVTNGRTAFACPYTAINVAPQEYGSLRDKAKQRARRSFPFYEYFGPTPAMNLVEHLGSSAISAPAPIDAILFLRKASRSAVRRLDHGDAQEMLIASNYAEFTYATSSLFRASDFLLESSRTSHAVRSERALLESLCENVENYLVEGDINDFVSAARKALVSPEKRSL